MTIIKCLDFCLQYQISLFAGQFAKYAEQGGAGHRLRHHRLRHCRRQHHGHGLLQDGQTAPDNLKLLSFQVIFKPHHWMKLISVDILQPSNSRLHHRRLFNPLLHDDPRHRKPKMAPQVFFPWFWLEVFFPSSRELCDIWLSIDYMASNASVMNLLAISVDRWRIFKEGISCFTRFVTCLHDYLACLTVSLFFFLSFSRSPSRVVLVRGGVGESNFHLHSVSLCQVCQKSKERQNDKIMGGLLRELVVPLENCMFEIKVLLRHPPALIPRTEDNKGCSIRSVDLDV